ncbi:MULTISPECIES: hypothetical protein [unclassified Roseitalea]|uniref:hypothetical protein n=1 Tax=unclassified Roseitalea TaxID=2639107 RepID=UPI00273FD35A|nr:MULTISPECIES: hypothetical protein [unclassified Roseitalea]
MARAMAEAGSFAIGTNGGVDGAPTLLQRLTHEVGGQAMPQYPGAYGLVAAPFYAHAGLKGLVLLNTVSALAAVILTRQIAMRLYDDRSVAFAAAALLGGATFLSTYALGIWPHALALALILVGIERAILCTRWSRVVSGLALGLAVSIRVDAILAVFAVFFWLRLFAAPARRADAAVFLLGLLPGLALASQVNFVKFGVAAPLAYGPADGGTMSERYIALMVAMGIALIVAMAVNVRHIQPLLASALARPLRIWGLTLGALALLLTASGTLRDLLWNAYVLVADLQWIDDERFQDGMVRLDSGWIVFWGTSKAALLQSVPFAVLALVPAARFLAGERARDHALPLAMIGAYITFYSLNQWHGGYASAMRYFLPALPFLAILSALALRRIAASAPLWDDSMRRTLLWSSAVAALLGLVSLQGPLEMQFAVELYVPLIIAAALALGLCVFLCGAERPAMRRAILHLAMIAIAFSAVASYRDIGVLYARLADNAIAGQRLKQAIPAGSLVFTTSHSALVPAKLAGVHAYNPVAGNEGVAAARAFADAGRCVFAYPLEAGVTAADEAGLTIRPVTLPGLQEPMGVLVGDGGPASGCAPAGF